jgi:hypothetical protein
MISSISQRQQVNGRAALRRRRIVMAARQRGPVISKGCSQKFISLRSSAAAGWQRFSCLPGRFVRLCNKPAGKEIPPGADSFKNPLPRIVRKDSKFWER